MGKLDGKVALITGGSDGIGLASAQQFLAEGAEYVFITGRRQEVLDEAVKKIGSTRLTAVQADASKLADLDKLYSIIKKQAGRLDVVFANAGVGPTSPLEAITEQHFDDLINVNVKGVLFTVQKALPLLVDGGSIILNASVSSIKAAPGMSVYCATKAAVRSFARCWTVDLKERKIRVNTISPGPVETSVLRGFAQNPKENDQLVDYFKSVSPMGRLGTPDEIAKAVFFLASIRLSSFFRIKKQTSNPSST